MKRLLSLLILAVTTFSVVPTTPYPASARSEDLLPAGDNFGYAVTEDSTPWIDADSWLGSTGSNTVWGPLNLGFPFKYFGRTYTQAYVTANGLIGFENVTELGSPIDTYLPKIILPNNIIAPFWIALTGGSVEYKAGGTAPNRYFVVEWTNVTKKNGEYGLDNSVWFEAVLMENGDIWMKYFKLPDVKNCNVGIEDESGWFGLPYDCNLLVPGVLGATGYRFAYPPAAARVKITAPTQSAFGSPGNTISYDLTILNAGDSGQDRFDFTTTSTWPVSLYQSDGITPLTDSDSSGKVDSGPIAQNTSVKVVAKVSIPAGAAAGAYNPIQVEARSKLDNTKFKAAALQAAVPASFAQVFKDDLDNAMVLERLGPGQQVQQKVTADGEDGNEQAVAQTPTGNLVYAWTTNRKNSNNKPVSEIKYTIRNKTGGLVRDVTRLTDYSSATNYATDSNLALAVTPDGHIGVLWKLEYWNYSVYPFTYNPDIYFAILNADGSVAYAPTNITGFSTWYGWNVENSVRLDTPTLAATGDNRFLLGWAKTIWVDYSHSIQDIYLACRENTGAAVGSTIQQTHDTNIQNDGFITPYLSRLNNNLALLTWSSLADGDIHYAVFNSSLGSTKGDTNLSGDGLNTHDSAARAVQFPNGKILVSWLVGTNISYAFLDTGYNRIGSLFTLPNPLALNGNTALSLTTDSSSRGILTWLDYDTSLYYVPTRPHIYYALLKEDGSVLTPPMFLHTSNHNLETSFIGYGNTTHVSSNPDASLQVPSNIGGVPGGAVNLPLVIANQGGSSASGVTLTATLPANLIFVSANPSPSSTSNGGKTLTWNLSALAGGASTPVNLKVQIPSAATIGTHYIVNLNVTIAETDDNTANNGVTVDVMAARQVFLPLMRK